MFLHSPPVQRVLDDFQSERKRKWKFNVDFFTLFDLIMILIIIFPADLSTERVPSLAEQVPS